MKDFEKLGVFYLGRLYDVQSKSKLEDLLLYDSKDLVTHAICIGMTGSGKTGLCISLIEEAAIDGIPTIAIDPKGDITNLLLTFPELKSNDFAPWINKEDAHKKGMSPESYAEQQADLWRNGLLKWGQDGKRIQRLRESADFTVFTPGSNSGFPISILKSFAAPPPMIRDDNELLQERITTTVTSLLGLLDIDADPIQSREHILISTILVTLWKRGEDLDIGHLIQLIQNPPITRIGVLDIESFYPSKDRFALAMKLNNLLAAPGFSLWLEGEPLDISGLLHSPNGKPQVSIFSIAHLNDAQRMFFVSLLLNQIVGWMRTQSGTTSLRAILYIDEVFGYLPPVTKPPSKTPLLTLLKQARAFGLGVVLSTQNPVDLDYKAISNAGTWFLGRLQTERDKERVMDGLEGIFISGKKQFDRTSLDKIISALGKRVFLMNNVHENSPAIFETRWAMSYLRGPLTREQIKLLVEPIKEQQKSTEIRQPKIPLSKPSDAISVPVKGKHQKPVMLPGVPQYFLPVTLSQSEDSPVVYYPYILGVAEVHFTNSKTGIDFKRDVVFRTAFIDDPIPVNWDTAEPINVKLSDLQKTAVENVLYADVPSAALNTKNYRVWKKNFSNWLFKTQKIQVLKSENLDEFSSVDETEREFRIRLQHIAREKRDQQADHLREKYAKKLAKLDEKLRRSHIKLEESKAQARVQKYQTAVSFGSVLLGGFAGRRSMGSVTSTTREVSRTMKKAREREYAKENFEALQQEKKDLEAQFESDVKMLEATFNPLSEHLESILIAPKKNSISVRLLSLVWAPI